MSSTFDRMRPRTGGQPSGPDISSVPDAEGKRALFSAAEARPVAGAVSITCSRCDVCTVVSLGQAVRAALPSLHVFPLRRRFPSYLRCPACGRLSWVRFGIRL